MWYDHLSWERQRRVPDATRIVPFTACAVTGNTDRRSGARRRWFRFGRVRGPTQCPRCGHGSPRRIRHCLVPSDQFDRDGRNARSRLACRRRHGAARHLMAGGLLRCRSLMLGNGGPVVRMRRDLRRRLLRGRRVPRDLRLARTGRNGQHQMKRAGRDHAAKNA